jgi:hypothetical protein
VAVDGDTTVDLPARLGDVPGDATHLVVSIGGNDALANSDLLGLPIASTGDALALFGERIAGFEEDYRAALSGVLALGRETAVCTIYNGNLESDLASLARVALMIFNDVILRVAIEHGLTVIDLRLVCTEPSDYANPIEPSGPGGRKIAAAIVRALGLGGVAAPPARVFGG